MYTKFTEKCEEKINNSDTISNMAAQTFEDILSFVRTSNLNFQIQLTPYSAFISLKKSPMKDKSGCYLEPSIKHDHNNFEDLRTKNCLLEKELNMLNAAYEKALIDKARLEKELESMDNTKQLVKSQHEATTIVDLSRQVKCKDKNIQELTLKVNTLQENNSAVSSSNADLKKKINDMKQQATIVETLKKEHGDKLKTLNKQVDSKDKLILELKKELKTFKTVKKHVKIQTVNEYHCSSSQTEANEDIPYKITDPLPPIFSSKVVKFKTPKLKFNLPRQWSMPELSKVCWCDDDPPPFLVEHLYGDIYDYDTEESDSEENNNEE